ncbi:PREDICTED: EF-hand and coiled-coil domain-containing protein 1-like isoform X1 [Cyprinodon variegatus]|uniref:EF-hand and coiled-coil domain-containing protein 1-like n=1 Tax=Cyprinodon variegatus TaxID=28743 RepID=A0A3Q2EEV9_CYPVA|nr:PREDICTED: EF-hand and coiled-coil domain-containing protein 1-like isoform X1 [Cyprinodon variegatus]
MRRTSVQPSPRAARKSEWLRSALAHHHCPDPGAENEIVVLATGMDQYLQEVFHHLAHPNQEDTVSAEDFKALCAVLGLPAETRTPKAEDGSGDGGIDLQQQEDFMDVCASLPHQLSFKDFHSRLCGYFRVRSAPAVSGDCVWRLPVSEDTELVERQIRLRWPRVRRRKCVSFDLSRDQTGTRSKSTKKGTMEGLQDQDEVAALRELVEDLRSALQGSDARCLALEVALRRERSRTLTAPFTHSASVSTPKPSGSLMRAKLVPTDRLKHQPGVQREDGTRSGQRRWDIRDPILRELKLIRSSRDGQLEEAIKFNERLEEELQWAYQEVRKLQGVESSLRKENNQIRKRAEEAREALSLGLQRVRLIQEQAQSVPRLQSKISKLESELLRYSRTGGTCLSVATGRLSQPEELFDAECLQRAVEGRAASDEEEDDRALKKREQSFSLEEKRNLPHNHGCGDGCQSDVHQPPSQSSSEQEKQTSTSADARACCSWTEQKQGRKNGCGAFKMVKRPDEEAEKTRLSLLEDKLTDSLSLLLQLRNKNVSRRVLEKMVLDSLDVCRRGEAAPPPHMQAADALSIHLTSSDLTKSRGPEDRGEGHSGKKHLLPPSGCQTSNSLLISG